MFEFLLPLNEKIFEINKRMIGLAALTRSNNVHSWQQMNTAHFSSWRNLLHETLEKKKLEREEDVIRFRGANERKNHSLSKKTLQNYFLLRNPLNAFMSAMLMKNEMQPLWIYFTRRKTTAYSRWKNKE